MIALVGGVPIFLPIGPTGSRVVDLIVAGLVGAGGMILLVGSAYLLWRDRK